MLALLRTVSVATVIVSISCCPYLRKSKTETQADSLIPCPSSTNNLGKYGCKFIFKYYTHT